MGAENFGKLSKSFSSAIKPLITITSNQAINLMAISAFDDDTCHRCEGSMWQVKGPLTYFPRPEVVKYIYVHFLFCNYCFNILYLSQFLDK